MVGPANRGIGNPGEQGTRPGGRPESTGVAGVVESVKERAQDLASSAASTAGDVWDSTRQGVQRAASQAYDSAGDAYDSVTNYMSRYPFVTLMVGFGLGFLVAQAFSLNRGENRYYG